MTKSCKRNLGKRRALSAAVLEPGSLASAALRTAKRIAILVVGGTVLLVGVALIVLPGPAFIVIPAGLAILAIEFAWARRWLRRARKVWDSKVRGHHKSAGTREPAHSQH